MAERTEDMKVQVDIRRDGKVVVEVLERAENENCTAVTGQLTQGLSIESDERTGPDCDTVHESVSQG